MDGYKTSQFTAYCEVVSKSNGSMERDYEYTSKRYYDDLLKPEQIGSNAAKKAIDKLNPKKLKVTNLILFLIKEFPKIFYQILQVL